ncbi:hypothetical protein AB0I84_06130 [Streptomyces spectabilis]|uniref:hypothetical protein n=1 Tax=Streptomyces spectabilis TaxID=68270 RepID=UPI0033DA82E3
MSRALQHELHARLGFAAQLLDLPLSGVDLERLAVELTPHIGALLAEREAVLEEAAPVPYALVGPPADGDGGMESSRVAGCVARVGWDVDLDSPAAVLAQRLRTSQHDVLATEVPDAVTLMLTVRPQSLDCWRWWLAKCGASQESLEGEASVASGAWGTVTVHLRGEGVPALQQAHSTVVLQALLGEQGPGVVR